MITIIKKHWKIISLLIFGVSLRFGVSLMGYNYDFESYQIVSKLVSQGKNVYAETFRYNYGPAWALLLGLFRLIANNLSNTDLSFRTFVIASLSLADLSIFFWLKKNFSQRSAYWFFFNPISIYVSGYHNQFDTIAIALGLYSTFFLIERGRKFFIGLLLLGLSIIFKHVFIFFPLWLIVASKTKSQRPYYLIPLILFVMSFVPFLFTPEAAIGIWNNVITYKKSIALYPFFPTGIVRPILMVIPMLIGAFIFRKQEIKKKILIYILILVVITPITAGQYFAIPLVAFSVLSIAAGSLFTMFTMWGLYMAKQELTVISIVSFGLCWIPLLASHYPQLIKNKSHIFYRISILLFFVIIYQCVIITYQFLKEQKQEFFILKIMHSSSTVFSNERKKNPTHIVQGKIIEGNFKALTNGLGFITVPFLLENPSDDFFKKDYKVTLSAREVGKKNQFFSETRNIRGGLTQDGIILGLPLIPNSKDKLFQVVITSTIPEGADYITINPYAIVQSRYFLTKNEVLSPSLFFTFIWYKTTYLISLQATRELIFLYICLIWSGAQLIQMRSKSKGPIT